MVSVIQWVYQDNRWFLIVLTYESPLCIPLFFSGHKRRTFYQVYLVFLASYLIPSVKKAIFSILNLIYTYSWKYGNKFFKKNNHPYFHHLLVTQVFFIFSSIFNTFVCFLFTVNIQLLILTFHLWKWIHIFQELIPVKQYPIRAHGRYILYIA